MSSNAQANMIYRARQLASEINVFFFFFFMGSVDMRKHISSTTV